MSTQHVSKIDATFMRVIIVKTAFHPDRLRRCQAAIIYAALDHETFTADECLVGELVGDDTKISGIAFGSMASAKLIKWVDRAKAKSESRNGAYTNVWTLANREKALTWLERNGFAKPDPKQLEIPV